MRYTKQITHTILFFLIWVTACTTPPSPEISSGLTTITPIPVPDLLEAAAVPTVTPSPLAPLPATNTPLPTADLFNQATLGPRATATELPPTAVLFPTEPR